MAAPAANGAGQQSRQRVRVIEALTEGGIIAWSRWAARPHVGRSGTSSSQADRQQKIIKEGRRARTVFWSAQPAEGANKLDKNGAYRQIVEDG